MILGNSLPRQEWVKRQRAAVCCKCTKKGHVARECKEKDFLLDPFVVPVEIKNSVKASEDNNLIVNDAEVIARN